jgi:hypothetical protein
MNSTDLKTLYRSELSDVAEPYLWSDAEVYQYIDDAQKMFCRLTDGISDATTKDVVQIAVSAGATWLDLHPAVKKIRAATRASDGGPLSVVNYEDLAARGLRLSTQPAPLRLVIAGMEEEKLRLPYPAAAADTIELLVFRLPIVDIDADDIELEIPKEHHMHLLLWAKSRGLLKQDSETFDKARSEDLEEKFRAYCAQAQREQENKRHKIRMVRYGGI